MSVVFCRLWVADVVDCCACVCMCFYSLLSLWLRFGNVEEGDRGRVVDGLDLGDGLEVEGMEERKIGEEADEGIGTSKESDVVVKEAVGTKRTISDGGVVQAEVDEKQKNVNEESDETETENAFQVSSENILLDGKTTQAEANIDVNKRGKGNAGEHTNRMGWVVLTFLARSDFAAHPFSVEQQQMMRGMTLIRKSTTAVAARVVTV